MAARRLRSGLARDRRFPHRRRPPSLRERARARRGRPDHGVTRVDDGSRSARISDTPHVLRPPRPRRGGGRGERRQRRRRPFTSREGASSAVCGSRIPAGTGHARSRCRGRARRRAGGPLRARRHRVHVAERRSRRGSRPRRCGRRVPAARATRRRRVRGCAPGRAHASEEHVLLPEAAVGPSLPPGRARDRLARHLPAVRRRHP